MSAKKPEKIRHILLKRTILKNQLESFEKLIEFNRTNEFNLKDRTERISNIYDTYEILHNELIILDSASEHKEEFQKFKTKFSKINNKIMNLMVPRSSTSRYPSVFPEVTVPKFTGLYEDWFAFKNTFLLLIDSQPYMSEIEKLFHLKSSLSEEIANDINKFSLSHENYSNVWNYLIKKYENKRIIISRHISLLMDLPVQEQQITETLIQLIGLMQKHVKCLEALNVSVPSEMLVHILERKLPVPVRTVWVKSLKTDKHPTIEQMIDFLNKKASDLAPTEDSSDSESNSDQ